MPTNTSLDFYAGQKISQTQVQGMATNIFVKATGPGGTITTTSTTYANVGTGLSITKYNTDTSLIYHFYASSWMQTTGSTQTFFALLLNGTANFVTGFNFVTLSEHNQCSGYGFMGSGLAAGTYTVQTQWKRNSGTGTSTMDTSDNISFWVRESRDVSA